MQKYSYDARLLQSIPIFFQTISYKSLACINKQNNLFLFTETTLLKKEILFKRIRPLSGVSFSIEASQFY